jgi:L-arabinose isomerase
MDFNEQFILMGRDGPAHLAISNEKPVLRGLGLYHGKRGYGISVECQVKTGPITILGMTQTADGKLMPGAAKVRRTTSRSVSVISLSDCANWPGSLGSSWS